MARVIKRIQKFLAHLKMKILSVLGKPALVRWRNNHYEQVKSGLNDNLKKALDDLEDQGFAICRIEDFAEADVYQKMQDEYAAFSESPAVQEKHAAFLDGGAEWKQYVAKCYAAGDVVPADSALFAFAGLSQVRALTQCYFDGQPVLKAVDYWRTFPSSHTERSGSRNWHRDPGDMRLLKFFIYMTDVPDEAGPTEYFPGSFIGGKLEYLVPHDWFRLGFYLSDEQVKALEAKCDFINTAGKKGDVVMINTTGIHRGGHSTLERGMANLMFTSEISMTGQRFASPADAAL